MKALKMALLSFSIGIALSIIPIAVYAACDSSMSYRDAAECHIVHECSLVGEQCYDHVCICAYNCGSVCGHWEEGPCPETGPQS